MICKYGELIKDAKPKNLIYICNSFIHSVFCPTTGPKPPPKRFLHMVRSRASSFKREYPLLSLRSSSSFLRLLPRLLATSISPFIFPSITCFRRQFLRRMWPIQFYTNFIPNKFHFNITSKVTHYLHCLRAIHCWATCEAMALSPFRLHLYYQIGVVYSTIKCSLNSLVAWKLYTSFHQQNMLIINPNNRRNPRKCLWSWDLKM